MILDVVHEQLLKCIVEDQTQRTKSDAKYLNYLISDIHNSYSRLESLRKECVDKYCKLFSELGIDDMDVLFKYMHEKQSKELKSWNDELKDILEYQSEIKSILDSINDVDYVDVKVQELKDKYFSWTGIDSTWSSEQTNVEHVIAYNSYKYIYVDLYIMSI